MDNEKVYAMQFAKIYPLLTAKAQKKGRTIDGRGTWGCGKQAGDL